jgi:hypothetical protein
MRDLCVERGLDVDEKRIGRCFDSIVETRTLHKVFQEAERYEMNEDQLISIILSLFILWIEGFISFKRPGMKKLQMGDDQLSVSMYVPEKEGDVE